jgi:CO/xanthine dehydrogenase FAD-binding subunit
VQSLELHEPATLPEAVGLLGQVGAKDKIVPGGSDLMAGVKKDWIAGKGIYG